MIIDGPKYSQIMVKKWSQNNQKMVRNRFKSVGLDISDPWDLPAIQKGTN